MEQAIKSALLFCLVVQVTLVSACLRPKPPPPPEPSFNCGRDNNKIVGGTQAARNSIPWQAALLSYWSGGFPFCGGVIISPFHILTAAHCAWVPHKWVQVGEHNIKESSYYDGATHHAIDCYHYHPKFNITGLLEYDFALLTLKKPLDLYRADGAVRAACLPDPGLQFQPGTTVRPADQFTVSGWGAMEETENQKYNHTHLSDTLNKATVPYYDPALCNDAYKDKLNKTNVITDNMICAGYAQGGIDSCAGDSGGPLTWTDPADQTEYLAGIVSLHVGCGRPNLPGVYARVTSALDWLRKLGVGENGIAKNKCPPCTGWFC